ncbi:MAG TPA: MATE family efflux transporter [Bryobacteraceae bacterium]|jgi:putative MATE family efflux protein|nr:MATE family efflux transporter [Bryobacteraceae bacterium]
MQEALQSASVSSHGVLATIREALSGSQRDLTKGNLKRAIVLLAIPMILEMLMESLFGVVDMFFVARLGVDSLATVALTESCLVLVFGIAMGLSMATTAFIARRIGEKDPEGAAVAAVQAIAVGLLLSILVSAAGIIYAPNLLGIMGASPSVIRIGATYTRILLGGSATIFLLFLINAIFRGAGDAALAMRALWLANLINIVLDPCLINGWGPFPKLNVMGAAVATTTGRGLGVCFQMWLLFGGHSRIRVHLHQVRLNLEILWRLLKVSFTGILQFLIATASWTGLVRLCATFGTIPVAGYTVAIKIFMFVILPSWGLSNSAATLVGQNLGAGKPERAEKAVYQTGRYTTWYMGSIAIVFLLFAHSLAAFFTPDPAVQAVATDCLRFISVGNICYAWGMVLVQAFNGAGDTRTPSMINFFCYWCFQIPLAWTLAVGLHWGPLGVFAAIPSAETATTIASLVLFRRGAWKKKMI